MIDTRWMTLIWILLLCGSSYAQSIDDIKKALTITTPVFKGLPDLKGSGTEKGITIMEPANVTPPSIDLHIPFDFNSDQLTPDAIIILRRLGEALKDPSFANSKFRIAGHTDAKGTAEYNRKLSERRAQGVRNYLIFQYDMDPNRLDAVGLGFTELADPEHPEDGINRRVQVLNLGASGVATSR
jgi:outer membrane protein OmpA-like peptidoglycan-associated protein